MGRQLAVVTASVPSYKRADPPPRTLRRDVADLKFQVGVCV